VTITERDWEHLQRDHHESGATVRRVYPRSMQELHIAVRHPDGARMLTLAITTQDFAESLRRIQMLPRTRGIEMDFDRRDARVGALRVILTDPSLREVFNPLASDIAAVAHTQLSGVDAVLAAVRRFEHWRQMLQSLADSGLSPQLRRGLFGELILLRDHLLTALPAANAVAAWTGPTAANQDFQLPDAAIEVKTSSGKEPQTLVISNERELDATGTGLLILAHFSLDERRGGSGTSLNAIVEDTQDLVADAAVKEALDDLLIRAGYLRQQHDMYDEPRYTVRKQCFWRVTADFPRITEADLRPGVGDCEYRISITGLEQYVLPAEDVLSAVMEGSPR
jgi:Putative  PD-(D/E)XK family member, (DUF4420)